MELKIRIFDKYDKEIKYAIQQLFRYFDVKLNFTLSSESNTEITMANQNKIVISNFFFVGNEELYSIEKIPERLEYCQIEGKYIPLIYGNSRTSFESGILTTNADIISSTFFMLSRWEEYVIDVKDEHERFDHKSALSVKNNFIHLPIVDYYSIILEEAFKECGARLVRKLRKFKITPTHDVDFIKKYNRPLDGIKEILGDLAKRKNVKKSLNNLSSKLKAHWKNELDPYYKFDLLLEISEKNNLTSEFYFMTGGNTKFDDNYNFKSNHVQNLIRKIQDRGHLIGIHPSYNSYNDHSIFVKEIKTFRNFTSISKISGRQHYLRFKFPETIKLWDKYCKYDLSLGYAKQEGFRCGTCIEFECFDISNRVKLKLRERPLIFMESTFYNYKKDHKPNDVILVAKQLKEEVSKFNGEFILLWHNSSLYNSEMIDTYNKILAEK